MTSIHSLAPLSRPLLTAPVPASVFDDPEALDQLLGITRVFRTIGFQVRNLNPDHAAAAVAICRAINEGGATIPTTIVAHFSPFHDRYVWPRALGANHWGQEFLAEIDGFESDLRALLGIAGRGSGVTISHVVLDSEVFGVQPWGTTEGAHHNGLVTAKNDIMFGIARAVLPTAKIVVYNQHVTGRNITGRETGVGGTSPSLDYPQDQEETIGVAQSYLRNDSKPRPFYFFLRQGYAFEFTRDDDGKLIRGSENWDLEYDPKLDRERGAFFFGPEAPIDVNVVLWPHPQNPKNVTGVERAIEFVKGAHGG